MPPPAVDGTGYLLGCVCLNDHIRVVRPRPCEELGIVIRALGYEEPCYRGVGTFADFKQKKNEFQFGNHDFFEGFFGGASPNNKNMQVKNNVRLQAESSKPCWLIRSPNSHTISFFLRFSFLRHKRQIIFNEQKILHQHAFEPKVEETT